jgi:hypothetical protein
LEWRDDLENAFFKLFAKGYFLNKFLVSKDNVETIEQMRQTKSIIVRHCDK